MIDEAQQSKPIILFVNNHINIYFERLMFAKIWYADTQQLNFQRYSTVDFACCPISLGHCILTCISIIKYIIAPQNYDWDYHVFCIIFLHIRCVAFVCILVALKDAKYFILLLKKHFQFN